MKISDHLYFYRGLEIIPAFGLTSGNSCVILGDTLTLTDPGTLPGWRTRFVQNQMGRDWLRISDISQVVLTHAHQDHAPAAGYIAEKLHAKVMCHPLEIPMLEEPSSFLKDEIDSYKYRTITPPPRWLVDASVNLLFGAVKPILGATAVREGDIIDAGAGAKIIELPGHRPGEIGVYIEKDSALVTGDIINWRRYDIPSLNTPVSDLDRTIESLEKILSLDIAVIINGHEKFIRGESRIKKWIGDVLGWCGRAKDTAMRAASAGSRVSLLKLGLELIGKNKDVPPYEIIFIAHAALKSIGYEGETTLW